MTQKDLYFIQIGMKVKDPSWIFPARLTEDQLTLLIRILKGMIDPKNLTLQELKQE